MGLPDLLKIAFVIGFFVFGLTPGMVIVERRLSAWMQGRIGPDRVGPFGLLQPLADAVKFIFKEDIIPDSADRLIFVLAPLLVLVPPALGLIVIPFGSQIGGEQLQVANLSVGGLFSMSVLSIAVYGLAFGGWASNNKYSLLGGLRASAQLVSYELALSLSIIAVLMISAGHKGELVGGYHTEYSSMKFALFMMGEYVGMTVMAALMTTFFLGGWSLPFGLNRFLEGPEAWKGLLSVGVFIGKVVAILFVYVIIRWTLPRFKYNQLMDIGWKRLVSPALFNVA